jgi:hypothetical protein
MSEIKEGWDLDVGKKGGKTHYYKNGVSLCGKAETKNYMTNFDKERSGNVYFNDCSTCIKKEHEAMTAEPLCYKKEY